MRSLLAILLTFLSSFSILSTENVESFDEIILPISPPQKVFRSYQTNFDYHHDKGFYLAASISPQWNHSLNKPNAKGVRVGGKVNLGGFVTDGIALYGSAWGNFLESASLLAVGPGVSFFFNKANIGFDLTAGIGRAFNPIKRQDVYDFSETVLAGQIGLGKYWWVSHNISLGAILSAGAYGLTLSEGKVSTLGWHAGLGLGFIFG